MEDNYIGYSSNRGMYLATKEMSMISWQDLVSVLRDEMDLLGLDEKEVLMRSGIKLITWRGMRSGFTVIGMNRFCTICKVMGVKMSRIMEKYEDRMRESE